MQTAELSIYHVGAEWPFPLVTELRQRGERAWVEVTAETWWHFLEVLPPIYFPGGFWVSEDADHDNDGCPINAALVKIGDADEPGSRYFIRELRRNKATAAAEAEALRELVGVLPAKVAPVAPGLVHWKAGEVIACEAEGQRAAPLAVDRVELDGRRLRAEQIAHTADRAAVTCLACRAAMPAEGLGGR